MYHHKMLSTEERVELLLLLSGVMHIILLEPLPSDKRLPSGGRGRMDHLGEEDEEIHIITHHI